MEKGKIKTIFLIVLLIMNIALVSFFFSIMHREHQITRNANEQMESLLVENNIMLDRKIIPKTNTRINGFYADRVISQNTEFIEKLIGSGYEVCDNVFKNGDKELFIENDTIKFSNSAPKALETQDYVKICNDYMKELGIKTELYKYKSTNPSGENTKLIFIASYGDYDIFDSFISIELSQKGIFGIQAKNLILECEDAYKKNKAVDINSVLIDLIKEHSNGSNKITSIVSIKLGYYIGKYTVDYDRVLSIPVWQIVTQDGQIYYYDARNGRFINE